MGEVNKYKIATIGSHSALQILKGAKDEGFGTIVICTPKTAKVYQEFGVADQIINIDSYDNYETIEPELIKQNAIVIPHGSFVAYLGNDRCENLKAHYYGNKSVLRWEANRDLERQWLTKASLKLPKIFNSPKEIDCSVIVKFHGARGGKGYFIANSENDFNEKIKNYTKEEREDHVIQEYIIGVPIYIHYFYSPITNKVEIMGFDKRYESNVDSLGRISARDQIALKKVDPSYVIVGNIPIVLRESFLPQVLQMGEDVIKASKQVIPPHGLFGPFCLECILTPEKEFFVFEISARIVAGTNPYIEGSPYTALKYDKPMSTGRRIALDIKQAIETEQIEKVLQ
ncbi:formate--phosphoribosylaminoimidazolecarboxamide ligase [Candidatus Woesearchaeota archaeon]|nr:formate--phosphoribosylaminoimidazolecarboxamide ligase [Candidatus Woesearchaeota archaeon]